MIQGFTKISWATDAKGFRIQQETKQGSSWLWKCELSPDRQSRPRRRCRRRRLHRRDRSFHSFHLLFVTLAPTLLSVFTSRLSKSRAQSPQPPGSQGQMGQQPSKRSKKGGKDKESNVANENVPSTEESNGSSAQGSVSRATGTSTSGDSDQAPAANGHPSINVSDPTGNTVSSPQVDGRAHASPYPANSDHTPQTTPSVPSGSSPTPSPKPTTAPLDIPVPTILNTSSTPFSPGSTASGGQGDTVGNGGSKDKLKLLDVDDMIQRLLDVGYTGKVSKSLCLKNAEIVAICQAAREVLLGQPTLIELSPPVKIVGDVHGQYSDLIRLFEMCGFPPAANYLFLGDYVDRGKQSLETILLLLCYKIKYPENFFLLRGNHECANVTRGECPVFQRFVGFSHRRQYMASTTSASDGAISRHGKPSSTSSTVFPSQR